MVFSSVNPVYLDPPNWHQLQQFHLPPVQQAGLVPSISNPSNEICPSHEISSLSAVDPAAGSIRPGSMTDRARLAKIPQPETALKCPRCESTNTKFCYFNNYSLSQPRHFCKTCRRYWTRGGALRNVPVGGGCRRNKKSKSTVKSSTAAATTSSGSKVSSAATNGGGGGFLNEIQASYQNLTPEQRLQAPVTSHLSSLMETLHSLSGYGNIGMNIGGTNLNQFPFLEHNLLGSSDMVSRVSDQFYGVKMEENNLLKKPLMGFGTDQNNNSCGQIWGSSNNNSNCWTDLSGLNNSSIGTATNLL